MTPTMGEPLAPSRPWLGSCPEGHAARSGPTSQHPNQPRWVPLARQGQGSCADRSAYLGMAERRNILKADVTKAHRAQDCASKLRSFVFVDDFLWLLKIRESGVLGTTTVLTLLAQGTPAYLEKDARINTWLGFAIDPAGPTVQMVWDKHLLAMQLLEHLVQGKVFTHLRRLRMGFSGPRPIARSPNPCSNHFGLGRYATRRVNVAR